MPIRSALRRKVKAVDVLSCDVVASVISADFVNRENVWVIQVGSGRRLLLEALQPIFVGRVLITEDLDRDLAAELAIRNVVPPASTRRLVPDTIAEQVYGAAAGVRNHDGKHAIEPFEHPLEPLALVEREDDLGISAGAETIAVALSSAL